MTTDLQALWDSFLAEWPIERVRTMTLDEYTNLNRSDAFVYWLESRTEDLGSIRGGSAFKWGIYRRDPNRNKPAPPRTLRDDAYAWYARHGSTADEAFHAVREKILEIIEAAQQDDLERIEAIDDFWPIVKWKIAFLYQDRESPRIFPVYNDKWLFDHYRLAAPGAKRKDVSRAVMYPTLLDRYADRGDLFDIARFIWEDAEKQKSIRTWALPLRVMMTDEDAEALCALPEVVSDDLPTSVHEMLADSEMRVGDELALLIGDRVRAIATLEAAEPEVYAWTQQSVDIVPELEVFPTKIVELDASERESIWGAIDTDSDPNKVQYWKISPGENAHLWEEWKANGYIAVGWEKFGDISKLDRAAFERRMRELQGEQGYGPAGPRQTWRFRQIRTGSRIVANQGTRKLLGIGTVIGPYEYHPEAGEYCHRLPVRWDDLTERSIERSGWRKTLIQLDEPEFLRLSEAEPEGSAESPPKKPTEPPPRPAPEPQSLILFGPPGTGKTWATMTRALQLIFPAEEVASWSADTRARQFRELQRQGRIEFVTFHQAYGYEEFVEGIRPMMSTDATEQVRYELHPGVFKRIALRAAADGLRTQASIAAACGTARFSRLWTELIRRVDSGELISAQSHQGNEYDLIVSARGNLIIERQSERADEDAPSSRQTASEETMQLLWSHRSELGSVDQWSYQATGDVIRRERNTGGGHHYTAYWIAMKLLEEIDDELPAAIPERQAERAERVQEALDRPQGGTVDFHFTAETPPYVLIIDEINRGNISKILGELITLLEPDKRLGATNELKLPLAYSPQHRFAVPPNLHIIGTMNTADRSIALMDVALRRRFRFEEMLPDSSVIRKVLSEKVPSQALVDLVCDVFDTMNARIRQVFDRDHQIGHAYFLKIRSLEDLRDVFADRVIPLLQEYFHGAWERVCLVLGCPYDDDGTPLRTGPAIDPATRRYRAPIILAAANDDHGVLGFRSDEYDVAIDFQVSPTFKPALAAERRPSDELLDYFLGLLNLDEETWRERAAAFAITDAR